MYDKFIEITFVVGFEVCFVPKPVLTKISMVTGASTKLADGLISLGFIMGLFDRIVPSV